MSTQKTLSPKLKHEDITSTDYQSQTFSEQALEMKQLLVFDSSIDPPAMFCKYFNVSKPKGVRFWKDYMNEKCPEKPRFYTDKNDRACMLVSVGHDQVYDLVGFLLFFVNDGMASRDYKIEKYMLGNVSHRTLGIKIRDEVWIVRVTNNTSQQ